MIWIIGGTRDSYQLLEVLVKEQEQLIVTVTTNYGKKLIKAKFEVPVLQKKLNKEAMLTLINKYKIREIIDLSHPFAAQVSQNAIAAAKKAGIIYLRYQRPKLDLTNFAGENIIQVNSYQKAAEKALQFKNVFLTIGSHYLPLFAEQLKEQEQRLIARVLPDPVYLAEIIGLGISRKNIIAVQGPFSREFNRVMFQEYEADVVISKASGKIGGLQSKLEAAADLKLPVIVIQRPELPYPKLFNKLTELLAYHKQLKISRNYF